MIEIEKYNAIDKLDADKRERFWIETLQAKLNQCIPSRNGRQYYQENIEIVLEKQKLYYEKNKTEIAEKSIIYYQENKGHILEQHKLNSIHIKNYMNNWRELNKEQRSDYAKLYYETNKEKISLQRKQKRINKKLQNQQQDANS